jgi:hypothetical protein
MEGRLVSIYNWESGGRNQSWFSLNPFPPRPCKSVHNLQESFSRGGKSVGSKVEMIRPRHKSTVVRDELTAIQGYVQ